MVEFALLLLLTCLVILGFVQVAYWSWARSDLQQAAIQGVSAGARERSPSDRCPVAESVAEVVLGHAPLTSHCTEPGNVLTLDLTDRVTLVAPLVENFPNLLRVHVIERALPVASAAP